MRALTLLCALPALTLHLAAAQADGPAKGVVELFTSQGCSSCPPADAAFSSIVKRDGVVALSWHVDYWNYLGWKDTFSSAAATSRQAAYGQRIGGGSYTPEFVVNGERGSSSKSVTAGLDGLPVAVSVSGGKARIGNGDGPANVVVVSFLPSATVAIDRGENAGRSVTYRHVVTGFRTMGSWDGTARTVSVGGGNCAVLLQRPGTGAIIGAAMC